MIRDEVCENSVGLLMTYRCNLNCKYCYIHKKRDLDMTFEMAQSILEPLLHKEGGLLDIKFYGGETLLSFGLMRSLIEWVEKGTWNRRYRFFGSTNGTLLNPEIKQWLREHAHILTMGLSYDGLPSSQYNNRGYDFVDVDFFIETWPYQTIQMTINVDTVDCMADGVIHLLKQGALVHPNVAYEDYEWPEEKIVEYGKQLNKLLCFYNNNEHFPLITQFVHDLNEYADSIDNHKPQFEMCGAGNGFILYDVDGQSYPCHLLSPLVLEGEKLQQVKDGLITKTQVFSDSECETCPYTSSCPTCIACNLIYRNKLQKRDKTHCRIMQTEVKAFIKKEVLRLKAKEVLTPKDATEIDSIKKLIDFEKSRKNH